MRGGFDPALAILWSVAAVLAAITALVRWRGQQRLRAAASWPAVTGRIIGVELVGYSQGGYRPQVSYSYVLGNQGYASDRLRPGGTPAFGSQAKAQAAIAPYQPGAWVTVRYNPADPNDAALELLPYNMWQLLWGIMAATAAGLAALITFA